MEARTLKSIAKACGGEQLRGSAQTLVLRVNTDSRKAQPGDLFFALKGERFDRHDFLRDVAKKGATAVVVKRDQVPQDLKNCAVMAVNDPKQALARLAGADRKG